MFIISKMTSPPNNASKWKAVSYPTKFISTAKTLPVSSPLIHTVKLSSAMMGHFTYFKKFPSS